MSDENRSRAFEREFGVEAAEIIAGAAAMQEAEIAADQE